jgi:hypothetical protein
MPEEVPIVVLLSSILEKYKITFDFPHRYTGERVRRPAYLIPLWLYPKEHSTDLLKRVAQVLGQVFAKVYAQELERTTDIIQNLASSTKTTLETVAKVIGLSQLREIKIGYDAFSPFFFDIAYTQQWSEWEKTGPHSMGEWIEYSQSPINKKIDKIEDLAEQVSAELEDFSAQCAKALATLQANPKEVVQTYARIELEHLLEDYLSPPEEMFSREISIEAWIIEFGNLPMDFLVPWGSQLRENHFGFVIRNRVFSTIRRIYFTKEEIAALKVTKTLTQEQIEIH